MAVNKLRAPISCEFPIHTNVYKHTFVTCSQWRMVGSRGPGARNSVGPSAILRTNVCQLVGALEAPGGVRGRAPEANAFWQQHIENWLKIRYLGRRPHPKFRSDNRRCSPAMENQVIQVDYIMKFVIDQENHSHIIITCSRLATN